MATSWCVAHYRDVVAHCVVVMSFCGDVVAHCSYVVAHCVLVMSYRGDVVAIVGMWQLNV